MIYQNSIQMNTFQDRKESYKCTIKVIISLLFSIFCSHVICSDHEIIGSLEETTTNSCVAADCVAEEVDTVFESIHNIVPGDPIFQNIAEAENMIDVGVGLLNLIMHHLDAAKVVLTSQHTFGYEVLNENYQSLLTQIDEIASVQLNGDALFAHDDVNVMRLGTYMGDFTNIAVPYVWDPNVNVSSVLQLNFSSLKGVRSVSTDVLPYIAGITARANTPLGIYRFSCAHNNFNNTITCKISNGSSLRSVFANDQRTVTFNNGLTVQTNVNISEIQPVAAELINVYKTHFITKRIQVGDAIDDIFELTFHSATLEGLGLNTLSIRDEDSVVFAKNAMDVICIEIMKRIATLESKKIELECAKDILNSRRECKVQS